MVTVTAGFVTSLAKFVVVVVKTVEWSAVSFVEFRSHKIVKKSILSVYKMSLSNLIALYLTTRPNLIYS